MVGAPTVGVVIDFQLLGDVQADPGAGIDVNGVELLGLTFIQPAGDFQAAVGDRLTEDVLAHVTGDDGAHPGATAIEGGDLSGLAGSRRFRRRRGADHPDALGEVGGGVGDPLSHHTGVAVLVGEFTDDDVPLLGVALVDILRFRHRPDGPVLEYEGDGVQIPAHATEGPVPHRLAAGNGVGHFGDLDAVGGQVVGPDDDLEAVGVGHLGPDGHPAHQGGHGGGIHQGRVARHRVPGHRGFLGGGATRSRRQAQALPAPAGHPVEVIAQATPRAANPAAQRRHPGNSVRGGRRAGKAAIG